MPALNYSAQFAGPVERGEKRQTIRAGSRIKEGDMLYHYTGMRTKACRKLCQETCRRVQTIRIMEGRKVWLGGVSLRADQLRLLALADGFASVGLFVGWFRDHYGLPFDGQVITW